MQYATHGKKVIFEGDVEEVCNWITKQIGEHQTVSLKEHFQDDIFGVYKNGEENYSYYYQCLGNGRYSIFIIQ
jgi:hypothetical protein